MIDHCKSSLCYFDSNFVTSVSGLVSVTEAAAAGAGTVTFMPNGESIVLRATNSPPLLWSLLNRKCAEGAFLTFDGDNVHLHIVEMKTTLSQGEWKKVLKQFQGMYFSSLAVAGVMKIASIASVTCYIAYKTERMSAIHSANLALIKTHVGQSNPFNGQKEWDAEEVDLPHSMQARIKKIVRDAVTGDAAYGAV